MAGDSIDYKLSRTGSNPVGASPGRETFGARFERGANLCRLACKSLYRFVLLFLTALTDDRQALRDDLDVYPVDVPIRVAYGLEIVARADPLDNPRALADIDAYHIEYKRSRAERVAKQL